jgi:hypothetical protein
MCPTTLDSGCAKAQEAAKADDFVAYVAGDLVDHEMANLAALLAGHIVYLGVLHIFT